MQPNLAIIVPTLNERGNIPKIYERLNSTLTDESWELIIVDDDSSDGTSNTVYDIASKDSRVRLIIRINRKGLSSACLEGMLSSCAPLLAVMDADLQHDVTLLPLMLETLNDEGLDMAIGSRYMHGCGTGEWHPFRKFVSKAATGITKMFIGNNITDPMSGFFMIRRTCFLQAAPSLSGRGFKILLDILPSNKKICTKELPYQFGKRTVGESKLDILVGLELFFLIFDKLFQQNTHLNPSLEGYWSISSLHSPGRICLISTYVSATPPFCFPVFAFCTQTGAKQQSKKTLRSTESTNPTPQQY